MEVGIDETLDKFKLVYAAKHPRRHLHAVMKCMCVSMHACMYECIATRCLHAQCRPADSLLPSSSVGRWAEHYVVSPSEQRQNVLQYFVAVSVTLHSGYLNRSA